VVVAVSDDLIYLFVHGELGVKVGTEVTNTVGGSNDRFANADSDVIDEMFLDFWGEYNALRALSKARQQAFIIQCSN
jgi:hypothetical protein